MVEVEATLCPICEEACTCPKSGLPAVAKGALKKADASVAVKKTPAASPPAGKPTAPTLALAPLKSRPKKLSAPLVLPSSSEDDDSEEEEPPSDYATDDSDSESTEDPALSFIRMIYSDEEGLDEEEAYALYQATQLFSSSSEDDSYFYQQQGIELYHTEDDEDGSEHDADATSDTDDTDDTGDDYEYTVVEYVHSSKDRRTKVDSFVAYNSDSGQDSEEEEEEGESDPRSRLSAPAEMVINSTNNNHVSNNEDENENDWTTWSVFDISADDQEIVLSTSNGNNAVSSSAAAAGTQTLPHETLLFATSATDKIPNIAPQVLAAISAAAKSMAAESHGRSMPITKYFSYITTMRNGGSEAPTTAMTVTTTVTAPPTETPSELLVEEEAGDEFLFFEEPTTEEEEGEDDCITDNADITGSDNEAADAQFPLIDRRSSLQKRARAHSHPRAANSAAITTTYSNALKRWSRVPISAFRRSRRPSIPRVVLPANALKTMATGDFGSMTLAGPLVTADDGQSSFDESATGGSSSILEHPHQRAHSVIMLDELALIEDSIGGHSPSSGAMAAWPVPKRPRSAVNFPVSAAPIINNSEWLNHWHWDS